MFTVYNMHLLITYASFYLLPALAQSGILLWGQFSDIGIADIDI